MNILEQSVESEITFGPFVSRDDGFTLLTGLVSALDHVTTGIKLSKNGNPHTVRHAPVTASVYDSNGDYKVTLDDTDLNTAGMLRVIYTDPATCLSVWRDFLVLPSSIYSNIVDAISVYSGGGALNARIAYSSLSPDEFLEIIQGEEKLLTFIVEADGRFDQAEATAISVKIKDPTGTTVTKTNSDITRITQELDVQVFRVLLDADNTNALDSGLARIEIAFDTQKAVLTHSLKVIEAL